MSSPTNPTDLLDLKLMPAWVNEPAGATDYSGYTGEEEERPFGRDRRPPQRNREGGPRGPRPRQQRDDRKPRDQRDQRRPEGRRHDAPREPSPREPAMPLPQVAVRFLPHAGAFESVTAQLKSGTVAYSVFALARLFLEKPERYTVRLTTAEGSPLHQLGETGPVAVDPRLLENGAFAAMQEEFYTVEKIQSEPMKGNFTNVARCRLSGKLLGPTNHHAYQPQLRSLYEQRFSRRMSFQDYQRQIEIVSDPAVVEEWKEQARSVTTYTTKDVEPPVTFNSAAEAERHFRQTHLPTLLRTALELTISGVLSRSLPDRGLGRVIEEAWAAEIRSPSKMMQELAGGLRGAGLNIFRHKRGMLFVSPIRVKMFGHDPTSVSTSINAVLQTLSEAPGLNRKQLAEKLTAGLTEPADADRVKLSLASDLRWLVSEGYLIEFNDGTLDVPRTKAPAAATPAETKAPTDAAKPPEAKVETAAADVPVISAPEAQPPVAAPPREAIGDVPDAADATQPENVAETEPTSAEAAHTDGSSAEEDAGGMSVEQSIEPVAQATEAAAEPQPEAAQEPSAPEPLGEPNDSAGSEPPKSADTETGAPEEEVPSPS